MSPFLRAVALTARDRVFLRASGDTLPSTPPPKLGRPFGARSTVKNGLVKQVALEVIAGKYPDMNLQDIGAMKGIDGGSLRSAICRLKQRQEKVA